LSFFVAIVFDLTERAEVFKSLLWEGHYTYIYTCRATTAGSYVVPPAKAEEMYVIQIVVVRDCILRLVV
jgi:hypothetical protein